MNAWHDKACRLLDQPLPRLQVCESIFIAFIPDQINRSGFLYEEIRFFIAHVCVFD